MKKALSVGIITFLISGCAYESQIAINTPAPNIAKEIYQGQKVQVSLGDFAADSIFSNGFFVNNKEKIEKQAKTILTTYLQQSQRFSVLDRKNLESLSKESQLRKQIQNLKGARYVLSGEIVEFGRKTTGDHQLFGVLGKGKK